MRPNFKEVNMNIPLATALKHSTWNSDKGNLVRQEQAPVGMDGFRNRKPFTEGRQLLNKDLILNAKFDDKKESHYSIFFNNEVFIVLTAPLHSYFHQILETKAGLGCIVGKHRSIINIIVGGHYVSADEVYSEGEWLKFGNRKLLSSYQAIANYLIKNDLHPETVKNVYLPVIPERKKAPPKWSLREIGNLFSSTYAGEFLIQEIRTFHFWTDGKVAFITDRLIADKLPMAFTRISLDDIRDLNVQMRNIHNNGSIKFINSVTDLQTYLNETYV